MDTPNLETRQLKDKFIRVLLSPLFETTAPHFQQEWFRDSAKKLGMEPLQFNGFLRQVWYKNTPAPQLIEVTPPIQLPPAITPVIIPSVSVIPSIPIYPSFPPMPTFGDTPLSPTGYRNRPTFTSTPITTPPVIRTGPTSIGEWKDTLVKIINGDIFGTVPEHQRLEYLVREYSLGLKLGAIHSVTDFNALLIQNWKNNAPEIPQLTATLGYGTVKNIFYRPTIPPRADVTFVGDREFINLGRVKDLVLALAKTIRERLEEERKKQYQNTGSTRGWAYESDFIELIDDMNLVIREIWYREGNYFSVTIPLTEYISTMQNWTDRYNAIIKELGKRHCINTHDPFDGTPVDEIPDGEYIQLANGICWHIMSLVEYIQGSTNGRNTSKGLSNYPTVTLWDKVVDFPRIIRHPLVKQTNFKQWMEERSNPKAIATNISVETLNRMERAGSLLRSVGPQFIAEVKSRLTPQQWNIYFREARADPDSLEDIVDPTMRDDIKIVIKQNIKSLALIEWVEYWKLLSEEERYAILLFNPKLEENVNNCLVDRFCVFGMGNDFLFTRNEIAAAKGIPTKDYGVSFE